MDPNHQRWSKTEANALAFHNNFRHENKIIDSNFQATKFRLLIKLQALFRQPPIQDRLARDPYFILKQSFEISHWNSIKFVLLTIRLS